MVYYVPHVTKFAMTSRIKSLFFRHAMGTISMAINAPFGSSLNSSPPGQNGCHLADDTFKCIFVNEKFYILIKCSLKFVPKGLINNILVLVQIMAWHRPGDKPLPEPMVVSLLTHIAYMCHSASISQLPLGFQNAKWSNEINLKELIFTNFCYIITWFIMYFMSINLKWLPKLSPFFQACHGDH